MMHDLVILFDVDNTLLNNDRVQADLDVHMSIEHGTAARNRYWEIFETLRSELGYADYLGALERYRMEEMHDPRLLRISNWLVDYPFAERLYTGALDAVKHARQFAPVVILSDGDVVFQPHKIRRSGLFDAVNGHVLIYVHKEHELEDVRQRYPADHYVLVDDKVRILTAIKKAWGNGVTTVFPLQGHYARDPNIVAAYPPADIGIERVGDLIEYGLNDLTSASNRANATR